mmetsp:Transcript_24255/g.45837  ORF Transcript_24255/g.45837 Transcript_24255/m.45837 type:complete len:304 (-) Transcript_24255:106-1017(-)
MIDDGIFAAIIKDAMQVEIPAVSTDRDCNWSMFNKSPHQGQIFVDRKLLPASEAEGLLTHRMSVRFSDSGTRKIIGSSKLESRGYSMGAVSINSCVRDLLCRGESVLHGILHGQLHCGSLAAPRTTAVHGILHTVHQLLSGKIVRGGVVDLPVSLQHRGASHCPTGTATALVLCLQHGEIVPLVALLRQIGLEQGHLAPQSFRRSTASAGKACPALLLAQLLGRQVCQRAHAGKPKTSWSRVDRFGPLQPLTEERQTLEVLVGAFLVTATMLVDEAVKSGNMISGQLLLHDDAHGHRHQEHDA